MPKDNTRKVVAFVSHELKQVYLLTSAPYVKLTPEQCINRFQTAGRVERIVNDKLGPLSRSADLLALPLAEVQKHGNLDVVFNKAQAMYREAGYTVLSMDK